MRAVTFTSFGGPEVLSVVDVPAPEPGEGQVRIRVAASPVQPADLAARSGGFGPMLPEGPRYVLGWDVAGSIDAVGPEVREYSVGDAVIGLSDWLVTRVGTQAEYVVLDATAVAPAPAGATAAAASTLPANAYTALQALDQLGLTEGRTLAITGAAGAVGGYAVELARLRGVRVFGLASPPDEPFLTARGATFVPRADDPVAAIRYAVPEGADAVLDTATLGARVLGAVADGGAFGSLIPPATPPAERGIRVLPVRFHSDGAQLRELVRLAEQGRLTLRVAGTYGFAQAAEAHATFAKGGVRGRLVLTP